MTVIESPAIRSLRHTEHQLGTGQAGIRGSKSRIGLHRLSVVIEGGQKSFRCLVGLDETGPHERLVGRRHFTARGRRKHWRAPIRRKLAFDLLRDGAGHLTLESQDIREAPFVTPCPDVGVTRSMDQLHGDPDLVVRAEHRTFDDSFDSELLGDFWDCLVCGPGHNPNFRNLAQALDQRLVHARSEVVLFGVLRKIL